MDLLVSVSVMVILLSILMPALRMAHEMARRTVCASNVHQQGLALQMYAHDHRDHLPPSLWEEQPESAAANRAGGGGQSQSSTQPGINQPADDDGTDTMFLRFRSPNPYSTEPIWDGLGRTYGEGYISHFGVFYCPSHHGDHPSSAYAAEWVGGTGLIASNYQYRVPEESSYLSDLERSIKLLADGMRTRSDYNHVIGNNFLRADLSVGWYADVNRAVYSSLPETVRVGAPGTNHHNPWRTLDDE